MELNGITEEFLRSIDIHTILPQQEPFVMIDTLVRFSMDSSTTEMTVRDSNIFVEDGRFTVAGMLENIAQTCAARIGFYNKYILHNDVRIGFIGAVKDFVVYRLPTVDTKITTEVNVVEEIFGMTLAEASISCGDEVMATTGIKLSVKDKDQ